jgi:hypothetical protein
LPPAAQRDQDRDGVSCFRNTLRPYRYATRDFQNSKAAITMISMALIILLSSGGNIWQLNRNIQLKDNDLKYRYIKSTKGINPENLYKLEDIFQYNRDKKLIREIRQNVENWEKAIQNSAEKVEHEKLRNSESNK